MKKSLLKTLKITSALSLLLGVPLLVLQNKEAEKSDAYSTSSLPTTIYLGDADSNKIKEYYDSLNNLSTSERQGTNLLKHLKTILKTDQKYYGYPSDLTWNMYEIIDRDWTKSPKESISKSGTYDSSSNSFKNYKYGSSYDNPYVRILYVKRNLDNGARAYGDHSQTSNYGFNREHIWPKSHGFNNEGASNGGALGDPHHLWAGQGHANNIHSNYFYGYVNTSGTYTDCGSSYSTVAGNYRGTSKTIGSGTVFEPQDSDKGDIARAVFYMAARYNSWAGSSSDTFDSCNPNLILSTDLSQNDTTGSSTSSTKYSLGLVQDLLNWNRIDPPDQYEIHRNNLVYYNYGGNRNPFIDYPEWAEFVWGKSTYNGNTYQSYSSTPTGYATPESDTINGYNSGGSTVSVTGISLNTNSTSVQVGSNITLSATISPNNATNKGVTWTTSNSNIATVDNGVVTGVAEGSATITATTSDGGYTDTCAVTVTTQSGGGGSGESTSTGSVTANDITSDTTNWIKNGTDTYSGGDLKFDSTGDYILRNGLFGSDISSNMEGLTVTINGKWNGNGDASTNSYKVEALDSSGNILATQTKTGSDIFTNSLGDVSFTFDANLTGCTGFKITYNNKGNGNWQIHSVSWEVSYSSGDTPSRTLTSISLDTSESQTTFNVNDDFNYDELVVTAYYDDETSDVVGPTAVSTPNMSTVGTKTVTVTYTEGNITKTATYQIEVVSTPTKVLESISLSGTYPTSFEQNSSFSHAGMIVTAHFSDSTSLDVTSSATFSGYDMSNTGNQTVTVSYTEGNVTVETTYTIAVQSPVIPSNSKVYQKITSLDDIEDGCRYILGSESGGSLIAMPNTFGKKMTGISLTINSNKVEDTNNACFVTLNKTGSDTISVEIKNDGNYLNSGSSTDFDVGTTAGQWTLSLVNGLFLFSSGNRGVIYRAGTTNKFGNYATSNIGGEYSALSVYKQVNEITYSLVTNLNNLGTNDEIILVGFKSNKTSYYQATTIGVSNYLQVVESTAPENGIIKKVEVSKVFKIIKTTESGNPYFRFYDPDNGYISLPNSDGNSCKYETSTLTSKSVFAIDMDSSGVITKFTGQESTFNYKYFAFNSSSEKFSCYTNNYIPSGRFSIYKKSTQVEADTWSSTFLNNTENCVVTSWSDLASSYSSLSDGAKQEIVSCESNSSTDYCARSQAMARYEYILGDPRFNTGLTNFVVGRNVSNARPNLLPILINKEGGSIVIIIVISLVSVSAIGGYFFLKSRKKEEF